jgi:hypothetical protein
VRALGFILLGMAVGAALLTSGYFAIHQSQQRTENLRRLNDEDPLIPGWLRHERPCTALSAAQIEADRVMSDVARTFSGQPTTTGLHYAIEYFGWQWGIIGSLGRCPPAPDYYAQLGAILSKAQWPSLREDRNDLGLAERLPPSEWLAGALARLAFNSYPLTDGPLNYDNRPYARLLLAEQGNYAAPWQNQALKELAGDTKLGTSAAHLAVAINPGEALPRVERLMAEMTEKALARQIRRTTSGREESAITMEDGARLHELAFALSMAGSRAEPFSRPLIRLLDQDFASGSSFGLLFMPSSTLCIIAKHIGGKAAAEARSRTHCTNARYWRVANGV